MKKVLSLFCTVLVANFLCAQNFNLTLVNNTNIASHQDSWSEFADFDNDGDQDLLQTRFDNGSYSTEILKNDGQGNYTVYFTFPLGLNLSTYAIGHIDSDQFLDVIITGRDYNPVNDTTDVYLNDGTGMFTRIPQTFTDAGLGPIGLADFDGDQDLDLFFCGLQSTSPVVVVGGIYLNDGNGNFTISPTSNITPAANGSVALADFDGDNDVDVFYSGLTVSPPYTVESFLYMNDGLGNFTEMTGNNFSNILQGKALVADLDSDLDQDLILIGPHQNTPGNTQFQEVVNIFFNDGNALFSVDSNQIVNAITLLQNQPYSGDLADIDQDGDLDFVISNILQVGQGGQADSLRLYLNDGNGNFSWFTNSALPVDRSGTPNFVDYDNDGDLDIYAGTLDVGSTGYGAFLENCMYPSVQSIVPFPTTVCDGSDVTLLIDGQLHDATNWLVYEDSCNGNLVGSSTANVSFTPNFGLTNAGKRYYIKPEGTCFPPQCELLDIWKSEPATSTIDVSACGAYTSPSGNTIWTESGSYTDVLTGANGCDINVTVNLTINPIPCTDITANGGELTSNISGMTYQWIDCDNGNAPISGANQQTFTATESGNYAVIVTQSNGCISTSDCQNVLITGINENPDINFTVAPNPSNGLFWLETTEPSESIQIEVLNALNQKVWSGSASEQQTSIDLRHEANGVYHVQIINGGNTLSERVVKN